MNGRCCRCFALSVRVDHCAQVAAFFEADFGPDALERLKGASGGGGLLCIGNARTMSVMVPLRVRDDYYPPKVGSVQKMGAETRLKGWWRSGAHRHVEAAVSAASFMADPECLWCMCTQLT